MDEVEFPILVNDVLYSTQSRMRNIWRIFTMDDKGELKIFEDKVQFSGDNREFKIMNIKQIYTTKQSPSYGTHIISAIISIVVIVFTFFYLRSVYGYYLPFFTGIAILLIIAILSLFPVSLLLSRPDWIGVLYIDKGKFKKAFFSEGELPKDSALRPKDSRRKYNSLFRNLKLVHIPEDEKSD